MDHEGTGKEDSSNEDKSRKKKVSKKEEKPDKEMEYSIDYKVLMFPDGADIDFDLKQIDEDRLFAYSLTLYDLTKVLERMIGFAPPSVAEDFIRAAKVLKGMVDSAKQRVDEKNGIKVGSDFKKQMEAILKIIAKDIDADGLDLGDGGETKIIVGGDLPEELRRKIEEELNKRAKKSNKGKKSDSEEDKEGSIENKEEKDESSGDIEM